MRPVWERTDGIDGYVSLEVDPTLAYDRERTFEQALRFSKEVDRAEPLREDPGHRAGPRRDRGLHREGRLDQRHADLLARALRGRRRGVPARPRAAGRRRRRPGQGAAPSRASSSPASTPRRTSGSRRSAGPTCRASSRSRTRSSPTSTTSTSFGDDRWAFLAGKGARPQRCLWASTSAKNPAYRDVIYVEELIGPDTVNTMPLETVRAFQDHGEVEARQPDWRGSTRRTRCSPISPRPASTTTTSSRRSRPRACRSSPTRSPSCSTGSAPRSGSLAAA